MSNLAKMKSELSRKAHTFRMVFNSDEGKQVMAALEAEAEPEQLFHENPHKTAYNCGKRDLLIFIKQILRYEDETK